MKFPMQFHECLSSALLVPVPDQVAAFSFNLFESARVDSGCAKKGMFLTSLVHAAAGMSTMLRATSTHPW